MAFRQIAAYVAAVLFAALAAAVVAVGLTGSVDLMPLALGIAVGHAIILGLPLFVLFRSRGWADALSAAFSGFITGVVPLGIDVVATLASWLDIAEMLTLLGTVGALSGIIFWLTLRCSGQLTPAARNTAASQLPAASAISTSRGVLLAAIALGLTGAVAAIPEITKHRTCHNMFRDGRTVGPPPRANIRPVVCLEQWVKLIVILEEFGGAPDVPFADATIFQAGVNARYVVVARHPRHDGTKAPDRSVTEYYYVVRSPDEAYPRTKLTIVGPMDKLQYDRERQRLGLPEFTKVFDNIQ